MRRQSVESEMDEEEEQQMNKRAQLRRERMGNAQLQQQQILQLQQRLKEKEKDTQNIQEEREDEEDGNKSQKSQKSPKSPKSQKSDGRDSKDEGADLQSARAFQRGGGGSAPKLPEDSQIPEIFKRADRRKRTIGLIPGSGQGQPGQQPQQVQPPTRRGSVIGGMLPLMRGGTQPAAEDENAPEEFLDDNYMQGKKTYRRQSMIGNHQMLSAGLLQQIQEKYMGNSPMKLFDETKNAQQELLD